MNRETVFVATVVSVLLILPLVLQGSAELTTSLVIAASLLLAILIADRRVNRNQDVALKYVPIEDSARRP